MRDRRCQLCGIGGARMAMVRWRDPLPDAFSAAFSASFGFASASALQHADRSASSLPRALELGLGRAEQRPEFPGFHRHGRRLGGPERVERLACRTTTIALAISARGREKQPVG